MSDDLKGDDFEDMEAWRQWSSNKPHLSQLHSDLLRWWSKGQRMSTEIAKLKAELEEATGIMDVLLAIQGDGPADLLRQAKVGIGPKTRAGEAVLRARAFLDKAGE